MKRSGTLLLALFVATTLCIGGCRSKTARRASPVETTTQKKHAAVTEPEAVGSKSTGCIRKGGMPDLACTPGIARDGVTAQHVCTPGYSASVRNVPGKTKRKVFEMYGDMPGPTGTFEVDHLISLELGGSNDIRNLWPEHADPRPGFHEKDRVENYLHRQVCKGNMTLEEAQRLIRTDWKSVYEQIKDK